MNRNYKVIWNRSLGCFTAVAEYAKSRGKTSTGSVSSSSATSEAISSGAKLLRLTAICAGLAASGFSMQAVADFNIQANTGASQAIDTTGAGETVTFVDGNNIVVTRTDRTISIATSSTPSFTTVTTTGNSTVGGNSSITGTQTVGGNSSITGTQTVGGMLNAKGGITVTNNKTVNMGGNKVTNVGNGTIAENGTDAATTGQLWNLTEGGDGVKYFHANSEEVDSQATGSEAIAIGPKAEAAGASSLAAGDTASASGGNATALGKSANASGSGAIALGQASAIGSNSFAAGNGAVTNTRDSIALGTEAGVGSGSEINDGGQRHSFIAIGELAGQNMDGNQAIAIGVGAGSNTAESNQVAIGTEAGTYLNGERNVSIGFEANKKTTTTEVRHATAIGGLSVADTDAVAVGYEAEATAQSVAIGAGSTAQAGSIALGHNSEAVQVSGISYLTGNAFTGESVSVGNATTGLTRRITNVEDGAAANDAVNVNQLQALKDDLGSFTPTSGGNANYNIDGTLSVADAQQAGQAVSLGQLNQAVADGKPKFYSVNPLGDSANENGSGALGADSANSMAIGHAASISRAQRATAVGYSVIVRADDGTAIGSGSTVDDDAGVAIGNGAYSRGNNSLAMGTDAQTEPKDINSTSTNAIAIGTSSRATDNSASALGHLAVASGSQSSALGYFARATETDSMSFGSNSVASGVSSQASGTGASASGTDAQASGTNARATRESAVAIGTSAFASAQDAIAFGSNSTASKQSAMALGEGATASTNANDVALGAGSITGAVVNTPNATVDKNIYDYAGTNATSTVSVGTAGNERTITNVAAGRISGASTDAVNGSQLFGTNQAVNALANNLDTAGQSVASSLGGTSAYDPTTHQVTAGLSVNGNTYTNVQSAIQYAAQGWGVRVNTGAADPVLPGETVQFVDGKNIKVTRDSDQVIKISTADDVEFTKVTVGNAVLNNTGLTLGAGNPSITTTGINAGNKVISGVATGIAGTDGVNVNQLNASRTVVAAGTNVANVTEAIDVTTGQKTYTVNANGAKTTAGSPALTVSETLLAGNVTQTEVDLSADSKASLTNADNALQTVVTQIDGVAVKTLTKANNTANFTTGDNVVLSNDASGIKVAVNQNIDLTSVKTGNSLLNNTGLTITGGPSVTTAGINAGNQVITGVANGLIAPGSKQAINGGQLSTAVTDLTNLGFNIAANKGTTDDVDLGETVTYASSDGSIVTTVTDNNIDFALGDDLSVGTVGPSGTNGFIGVNGKDGVSGVAINGSNGSIGLTGPSGVNGTISVKNGAPGLNGATGPRLDLDGKEIATLQDGLNFAGNSGATIAKTLNGTLNIEGALSNTATASGANLRVDSDGNKLNLVMARNLTELDSVTVGNSLLDTNGLTITNGPSVTTAGINAGNKVITDVANGNIGANSKQAINGSQLFETNQAINQGFNISAAGGTADNVKLGETVNFTNTDNNLVVSNTVDNGINYNLADVVNIGTGSPVQINGINGTISGLTNKTFDPNATYTGGQAATQEQLSAASNSLTDLGLRFKGDNGATISRNLGQRLDITGGATTPLTAGNIGVSNDGSNGLLVQLAENIDLGTNGSVTTGDTTVNNDGIIIAGGTKFTSSGINAGGQQIEGVADGVVSAVSQQAINGSQLFGTAQSIADNLGGGSTVDSEGRVTAPTFNVRNDAGTTQGSVGEAIEALNQGFKLQSNDASNMTSIQPSETVDIGTVDGETNILVEKNGNIIDFSLNRDIDVDSVTTGNTTLSTTGIKVTGGTNNDVFLTNNGLFNGGNIIRGVASGLQGGTLADATGPTLNNAANIGDLQNSIAGVTDAGLNFVGDDGTVIDRNLGDTLNVTGGATGTLTDNNIGVVANGTDGLSIKLAEDINLGANGSVTTGNTVMNDDGISIVGGTQGNGNDVRLTKDGLFNGGNTIKGVGDGRIDATSNQAINGSQLFGTATSIANNFGGDSVVNPDGTVSAPTYTLNNGNNDTGTTDFNNVGDALGNLDGRTTTNTADIAKGFNITADTQDLLGGATEDNVKLGQTIDFTNEDGNLEAIVRDNKIVYNLSDNINVSSVTATDGAGDNVVLNQSGLVFIDSTGALIGPSITKNGINAGNQQITGVASAGDITDIANELNAVNAGDLNTAVTGLTDLGFNITADTQDLLGDATEDNVKLGQTIDFTNEDGNLEAIVRDNKIVYNLSDNINVSSVTATDGAGDNVVLNQSGLVFIDSTGALIGPSITKNGINAGNTVITNVAPGSISATSTDAINGSQLFNQGTGINNIIGGNTVYDPTTGTFTNTNIGATGKDNINDAIEAVGIAAAQAKSTVSGSANVTINKTGPADGPNDYQVVINDDISLDSVTTGNTVMNNDGVVVDDGDGNSSTMTTAGTTVTNADGDTSSYGAGGMVAGNTTDGESTIVNQDGLSFTDADGDATGPTITAGGINAGNTVITGVANGEVSDDSTDAINGSQLNAVSETANRGFDITTAATGTGTVNGTTVANVAPGSLQTVTAGNNISISQNGTGLTIATNPDLIADSVTATDDDGNETTLSATGTTIIDVDGNTNNSTATGNTITNGDNVTTVTGSGTNVTDGTNTSNYGANGLTLTGGPNETVSLTNSGLNNGGNKVTGVADGIIAEGSQDAINGGQLNTFGNIINNSINELGYRIDDVEDDANAGISAAMAMSSIPQSFLPGRSLIGGGVATYNGESAVAVGLSRVSDNGRWVMKVNGTADTQGNAGGAIGAGFHF